MGKTTGFIEYPRRKTPWRDPIERSLDYYEINAPLDQKQLKTQGARCMDCGVPFCESDHGCPIDNLIPEWNDFVYQGRWKEALNRLSETNNFPEFTGRTCPAPCEGACVLGINEPAVTIKSIENAIVDVGFENNWIRPHQPSFRTNKSIAIVGSGPAGLTAADQLNKLGHQVTVFERDDRIGGLLMYGIPNMKLSKSVVSRRIKLLQDSGINFYTNIDVGIDLTADEIMKQYDAVLLATGATVPRDLDIPGRELKNVYFAMEFLTAHTKSLLNSSLGDNAYIDAKDKNVIVIGGGDTGTDCIATAIRHGCKSLVNMELLSKPPLERDINNPWPLWPNILRTDYGHQESIERFGKDPREYEISSNLFVDDGDGKVSGLKTQSIEWCKKNGKWKMDFMQGTEKLWEADLILLAMGFTGPEKSLPDQLGVGFNEKENIDTPDERFLTTRSGVFTAGDCRKGQSLVVWAINEGRGAASAIDKYLKS